MNRSVSFFFFFRSSSTSLYCFLLVSSRVYNAAMADSSAQSRLSKDTRSEKSAKKGFPIFFMMLQRLVTCLWKVFCVDRPCSWFREFWGLSGSLSERSSLSNCFRSLDSSGSDSIQRLKATGFSVRPIQPPEPFTWSNRIPENVLAVFEITQLPLIWNSSLIGRGKDFISLIWTDSYLA